MAMPVLGRRVRGGTRAEEQREGLDRKNYEGGIGVTHGNGWLGMEMVDLFFLKKIMYLFLERGEEREKRGKQQWLPFTHLHHGTYPATQACAPDGSQTCNLLVSRMMPNPRSHTSEGRHDTLD